MSEPEERAEIGVEVAYAEPGRAVVTALSLS